MYIIFYLFIFLTYYLYFKFENKLVKVAHFFKVFYFVFILIILYLLNINRQKHNRERALERLEKLKDALQLQIFLQECDEVCIINV